MLPGGSFYGIIEQLRVKKTVYQNAQQNQGGGKFIVELHIINKAKRIWDFFTLYEKCWFFSILILAVVFAFIFPEEDVNGVRGSVVMALYLADIVLNIM